MKINFQIYYIRCLLTSVNPETGVKNKDQEPLKTLKTYRQNKELYGLSPMLGICIVCIDFESQADKCISIGDKLFAI